MAGLIGKKMGMTQLYNDKEELVPVTVVAAGPCPVVQVKTKERNGYSALQLAYEEVPARKANKPRTGHFAKVDLKPHRVLREFRLAQDSEAEVGQVLDVSQFAVGDRLKVTGRSKGKGFAGVMKRHNFSGKNTSHGTPNTARRMGSIGQGTTPGKVWRGKPMPGHQGDAVVTVKGLSILRIDADRNLLFVKGAVPGGVNGVVYLRKE